MKKFNYVDFQLANSLKARGFNEQCRAFYCYLIGTTEVEFRELKESEAKRFNHLNDSVHIYFAAPTIDQAFTWLKSISLISFPEFKHPEIKEGEVLLINVLKDEVWDAPPFCVSVRRGNVAYTTNGKRIVQNMQPLFGLLKK